MIRVNRRPAVVRSLLALAVLPVVLTAGCGTDAEPSPRPSAAPAPPPPPSVPPPPAEVALAELAEQPCLASNEEELGALVGSSFKPGEELTSPGSGEKECQWDSPTGEAVGLAPWPTTNVVETYVELGGTPIEVAGRPAAQLTIGKCVVAVELGPERSIEVQFSTCAVAARIAEAVVPRLR